MTSFYKKGEVFFVTIVLKARHEKVPKAYVTSFINDP